MLDYCVAINESFSSLDECKIKIKLCGNVETEINLCLMYLQIYGFIPQDVEYSGVVQRSDE